MAQRLELVFFALSVFHEVMIRGNNTLPGSTSFHLGAVESPVYLVILEEEYFGGAPSVAMARASRISRSSRTLVPCRTTELNPKCQAMVVRSKPESAWSQNDQEYIYPPRHQHTIYVSAGHALDRRSHIRHY